MKKIELHLNYNEIKKRIEIDKNLHSVGEWAELIGVKIASISNIHGKKAKINPSLEYVVAVSRVTKKPVEWYLYGEESGRHHEKRPGCTCEWLPETQEACRTVKKILESGDKTTALALKMNMVAFDQAVDHQMANTELKNGLAQLRQEINHLKEMNTLEKSTGTG